MNTGNGLARWGTMGGLVAGHDWSETALGPIDAWPLSLRSVVTTVLGCQVPMYVAWGPELTQIYNDAYVPILGPRHPAALGGSAPASWPEIWPTIGPMWADVLKGVPVGFDDFKLTLERYGYPEDRYFNFSYSPVPDDDGHPAGVLVTFVDTTERVLAEQRARFQLKLADGLRGLADPDAITGWTCSVLGAHLDARRVGYALIREAHIDVHLKGWHDGSVESIVGRSLPLQAFGPEVARELEGGRTVRLDDVSSDARVARHRDVFELLRAPAMLIVPVMRDGGLIAVVAVGAKVPRRWTDHEISLVEDAAERTRSAVERAIAEAARNRADAYYRFVLDRTFAAVVVHDLQGDIEFANPMASELLGLPVADLHRRALVDPKWRFLREDGSPMPVEEFPVSIVARTLEPLTDYVLGMVSDAHCESKWVLVTAFPQFDEGGAHQRTIVSFIDITSRKAVEAKLLDADRRKDEFLAMLAHELRNPLAPIATAAQLLQMSAGDIERVSTASAIIARQTAHMTKLVDDLLDVSRVTRGLVKLDLEPVELPGVISSAVEQVRPLIEARGHVLTTRTAPEPLWTSGDRVRLIQVVANLVGNAARYTQRGGTIDVTLQHGEQGVEIIVSDNGTGIEPELLPHLFDLFTQGRRSPDRQQGGLGIGLALVRTLVELHGGTVRAESAGPGLGSRFHVALPAAPAASPARGEQAPVPTAPTRPLQLMVVDDNIDTAMTMADLLTSYGFAVAVAHDGKRALDLAASMSALDAMILDIGLPDMSGHALAEAARRLPVVANATLIALTGYGQPQDRADSRAAGFDHHLVKPVVASQLLEILHRRRNEPA